MMKKELTAQLGIEIDADKEHVWDVLTNPKKIREYLFGTEVITDWEHGSPIIFQGEYKGKKYRDKGKIVNNVKNDFLQYTYWSGLSGMDDNPENYALISFKLDFRNGITDLTLTQSGFQDEEAKKHSIESWKSVLKQIKQLAED